MNVVSVRPDYLGPTWVATSFALSDDDGGAPAGRPDVAVLVAEDDAAELANTSGIATLYLPGFIDTFFHVEQAAAFREIGVPLLALEMRRSGRALRSEASRDDIRDLYVREEEIGLAIEYLHSIGARRIILVGHSTGGLQAALWAADHPGTVDAVVLNSPWLEHNGSALERGPLTDAVDRIGARFPRMPISILTTRYARSLHTSFGGEFTFDPRHKPLYSLPVRAGFFRTVRRAHRRIAAGTVRVLEPLLVAHSDCSGNFPLPSAEDLRASDCLLAVEDIKRLAPLLSPDVELLEVPGGRHDLALSEKPARDVYTKGVLDWLSRTLGLAAH